MKMDCLITVFNENIQLKVTAAEMNCCLKYDSQAMFADKMIDIFTEG